MCIYIYIYNIIYMYLSLNNVVFNLGMATNQEEGKLWIQAC